MAINIVNYKIINGGKTVIISYFVNKKSVFILFPSSHPMRVPLRMSRAYPNTLSMHLYSDRPHRVLPTRVLKSFVLHDDETCQQLAADDERCGNSTTDTTSSQSLHNCSQYQWM